MMVEVNPNDLCAVRGYAYQYTVGMTGHSANRVCPTLAGVVVGCLINEGAGMYPLVHKHDQ